MVDFSLAVARDGWAAANGWSNGGPAERKVSLTA
jgi:[lysine-biosynthesis-protein LysW]--L-2-aminoadipate ligase